MMKALSRNHRFYSVTAVPEGSSVYTWAFASDDSFLDWQNQMKESSLYPNTAQPSADAKYVTLSTCNGYAGTNRRLIVWGQQERTDKLQEVASWHSDSMARYNDELDTKKAKTEEIHEALEQVQKEQRNAVYAKQYGLGTDEPD